MPSYDFEVWQGDRALHSVKGVELERPEHAWDRIGKLARRFNAPGCHIAVKDETGGLAILVGPRTAQRMLSMSPDWRRSRKKASPKSPSAGTFLYAGRATDAAYGRLSADI